MAITHMSSEYVQSSECGKQAQLQAENSQLREELRRQWEANHAEHCGTRAEASSPRGTLPFVGQDKRQPTQKSRPKKGKPIEIPVPKRRDFEKLLKRAAKPVRKSS